MPNRIRITPACAGNRTADANARFLTKDHPRVCGEQVSNHLQFFGINGSPPRVRGTAKLLLDSLPTHRITPACAGNSFHPGIRFLCGGDHPRVCGEQGLYTARSRHYKGSPPRVRGTVSCGPPRVSHFGITPACAGNRWQTKPGWGGNGDHPRVCGEQAASNAGGYRP